MHVETRGSTALLDSPIVSLDGVQSQRLSPSALPPQILGQGYSYLAYLLDAHAALNVRFVSEYEETGTHEPLFCRQ